MARPVNSYSPTIRIAERLPETGAVDAVLTMAPDPADRGKRVSVADTRQEYLAGCRGMRMGYAPSLALLDPVRDSLPDAARVAAAAR